MEEAYAELYQQFLNLRALCLKQAALLRQLTAGTAVPHGELSDMMSISVQCTQDVPASLHEKHQPLAATAHNSGAQCGVRQNMGTFSDVLTADLSRLCVDGPSQKKDNGKFAPSLSTDSWSGQGASSIVSRGPCQADHFSRDRTMLSVRTPVTDSPSLAGKILDESGGMMMSDVTLQSHVCEFCQAVFPGETSTTGEFLRHLYTHVT